MKRLSSSSFNPCSRDLFSRVSLTLMTSSLLAGLLSPVLVTPQQAQAATPQDLAFHAHRNVDKSPIDPAIYRPGQTTDGLDADSLRQKLIYGE